ncbi:MAG: DMT family transporter [Sphingobium sp.]|tara:strand:+ start:1340 stop:2266 length:927 start_codon:yes stop_codon:yes gene_type:complete
MKLEDIRRPGGPVLTPNLRGALWMLGSAVSFTFMTTLVKFLGSDYPASLQAFYRSAISWLILAPAILHNWRAAYVTRQPAMLIFRSATGTLALIFAFYAYQELPLAEANALSFTRSLWIVPLAAVLLHEHIGRARILATLIGFAGVLVMLRPSAGGVPFGLGEAAALASSFLFAFTIISIKFMSRDNSAFTLIVWGTTLGTVFALPAAFFVWRWPGLWDLLLLGTMGVMGVITQVCYVKGMHVGEAAAMAPIDYVRLVFAVLIGLALFHEIPDGLTLVGAAVIVGATLYITWREHRITRQLSVERTME